MDQLTEQLNKLWGSKIVLLDIDIKSHTIHCRFVVWQSGGHGPVQTDVSFIGVETVCFGAELASRDMQSQLMECVSIEVRHTDTATLQVSFHTNAAPDYLVQPNIVMEIDSSFLAVRAHSITIDAAVYHIA